MDQLKKELIDIILENAPAVDKVEVGMDTNLINDLLYDSISIIHLIVEIENKFNIEFDTENLFLENIDTVRKIYQFIAEKKV